MERIAEGYDVEQDRELTNEELLELRRKADAQIKIYTVKQLVMAG